MAAGQAKIATGVGMLDHLLEQIARHGLIDITIKAEGDLQIDPHHTAEDVAICLGRALKKALGQREGIVRFGHAVVPLDEALALVAVDLSGRGYASLDLSWTGAGGGAADGPDRPHALVDRHRGPDDAARAHPGGRERSPQGGGRLQGAGARAGAAIASTRARAGDSAQHAREQL